MATHKQIEANRLNAQKSTGPRSVEGRGVSSQNALKTGIDALSIIIRGEDSDHLETLTAEYLERFRPRTPEQRHYVDSLIRDDWQLRRLAKADAQIWDRAMNRAYHLMRRRRSATPSNSTIKLSSASSAVSIPRTARTKRPSTNSSASKRSKSVKKLR